MLKNILILSLLINACGAQTVSRLSHKWGKLRRDANNSMVSKCQYKDMKGDYRQKEVLKKASAYLRKVAKRIAEESEYSLKKEGLSSPFQDKFAFENFCIEAQDTKKINAFASPITGNVYAELKIIELAENDAQVATFIGHEMAHVLMAHFSDYVTPTKTKEDFQNLKASNLKKLVGLCYEPKAYGTITSSMLEPVLGKSERLTRLQNKLNEYYLARFSELFKPKNPVQGLLNCRFIESRQDELVALFEQGDKLLSSKPKDIQQQWKEARRSLYRYVNDAKIQKAFKDARMTLDEAAAEFEDGADALLNWKEQEADEVGMELIYRAGFDISEAPRFWHNMMLANKIPADECLKNIAAGKLQARGRGTHPHPCFRYNDLSYKETKKHAQEYEAREHLKKEIFKGELAELQKAIRSLNK